MRRGVPGMKLAARGSLQADILADLVALRRFYEARDRAFDALVGRKLPRSHLREELLRMVVIEFGFGQLRTVAHYEKVCAPLGSSAAIRGELHLLAELGLVLYLPAETDRKALQVGPTQTLVDWYASQMPQLMRDVEQFVSARRASQ